LLQSSLFYLQCPFALFCGAKTILSYLLLPVNCFFPFISSFLIIFCCYSFNLFKINGLLFEFFYAFYRIFFTFYKNSLFFYLKFNYIINI